MKADTAPPAEDGNISVQDTEDSALFVTRSKAAITAPVTVQGKFLFAGDEKYWIRGTTYGTFRPDEDGGEYKTPEAVEADFAAMVENGVNTVRTYTVPPHWLLDLAQRHGLRLMIGLPWEQHITFLDEAKRAEAIEQGLREQMRRCAGHPAILCYAIGNEIPASIVRWHGRRRVERFLHRLYLAAKEEDPEALVTYVNFPTTEYLQLPFLDLVCFNVYLETPETLKAYLARLHNLTDDRPLLMAEIGLDSRRNGAAKQAEVLDWQVRSVFEAGCCGIFVYAWTDEWHRGGHDIEDWDFGLTTRERAPKPALEAVRQAFVEIPFAPGIEWPKFSVVVCSYNGSATLRDTLEGLQRLDYPDYEVIVVNDGSTDRTPEIAAEYPVRLISTENRGLSNARNTGWQEASGELIAYIDDDAWPDPHWLKYLAHSFLTTEYVGVGGPNIAPPGDGPIADCVANAPGGPVHVLLSDTEAEHIPGCNMAFRREALAAIDGFDARYRAAGDDVDLCWRLQEQVGKIGFHPAAMDWHHRRNSLSMYWKQQQGYGKAEALLEEKWPEKYNALGHYAWSGRLYGKGLTEALTSGRWHVYHGQWGTALFQSLYAPATGFLNALPLMPEWVFVIGLLALLSLLGLSWPPLLWAFPLLVLAVAAPVAQAVLSAAKAKFPTPRPERKERLKLRALTAALHLIQPVARLKGRLQHGLTPWRRRGQSGPLRWRPYSTSIWRESWQEPSALLEQVMTELKQTGAITLHGGDYDNWDLDVRGGFLGAARLRMAVEEHGAGKQLFRFRIWPRFNPVVLLVTLLLAFISLASLSDGAWFAALATGLIALSLAARGLHESSQGMAAMGAAVRSLEAT